MLTYLPPRDQTDPLVSDPGPDGPEWTDPAADHHRDLTVLTAAVRGERDRAVRTVNATLGMNRQAAPQRLTRPCCRRKCRIPCGNYLGHPAETRGWPGLSVSCAILDLYAFPAARRRPP
jgi:hypothetical protein